MVRGWVDQVVSEIGSRDPFAIAAAKGIAVFEYPMPRKIQGLCLQQLRAILLNSNQTHDSKVVVLAHELCHVLFHPPVKLRFFEGSAYSKYERQADLFASYLLVPDEYVRSMEGCSVEEIAAKTHVPVSYLLTRISL
jgi:Zn-dependent peptidase ImmA (M78 family)